MSTPDSDAPISIAEVRERIEDYRSTILALQSFIGVLTWDNERKRHNPDAKDCLGRRMETTQANRISPLQTVTPDAVVQRTQNLGYVTEAKKSLPADQSHWLKIVEQLEKYDDDLLGWWNDDETIASICVVLLLHHTRSADFANYLESLIANGSLTFVRPVSVVEFARSMEAKEFLFLRKYWGKIEDSELSSELESSTSVPVEDLLASYGERKFYDSPPIVEHTMYILWQDIFTDLKSQANFDEGERAWLLDVDIEPLTHELQRLYGSVASEPRSIAFPKTDWIREAMEAFVALKLAQTGATAGRYIVYFKRITGDILDRFSKHRIASRRTTSEEEHIEQLPLI